MSTDLRTILDGWEYEPGKISVRKVLGADGDEKIAGGECELGARRRLNLTRTHHRDHGHTGTCAHLGVAEHRTVEA